MKRRGMLSSVIGVAFATWTAAGGAYAAPRPAHPNHPHATHAKATDVGSALQAARKVSVQATIDRIDGKQRNLVLRDEQGRQFTVHVPPSMKRFHNLKAGDHVDLDYYESVGLSLKAPKQHARPRATETQIGARSVGKLPGGIATRTITATAKVVDVDRQDNQVTVKRPGGQVDTIDVTDPAMQAQLGRLEEGDRIQATFTEAVALRVTPERSKRSNDTSRMHGRG